MAYRTLPLAFEVNGGQTDAAVRFLARGNGYQVFLTDTEAVISENPGAASRLDVRIQLLGSQDHPRITGVDELSAHTNYFLGSDPAKWRTNVPMHKKVRYASVYPGVDLIYYGNGRQLEYDFLVAPGADPSTIRFGVSGAGPLTLAANGDLLAGTGAQQFRLGAPVLYQEVNGRRRLVPGGYKISGNEVSFEIADYDRSQSLVIDPTAIYATYLGGSGGDAGTSIAIDGSGNAYVLGDATSANFPVSGALQATRDGARDAFISAFSSGGALLWSTYLGGSGSEFTAGIAEFNGYVYITGYTSSTDFPLKNAYQSTPKSFETGFVSLISTAGNQLAYSTYFGGSVVDQPAAIAVDSTGNAYVTGTTQSPDFPTKNAYQSTYGGNAPPLMGDAFVFKLSPFLLGSQELIYSTFLGGSSADAGTGIACDVSGNAYVTGGTASANFPTSKPLQAALKGSSNAFVTELDPTGTKLLYSTYLGGSGSDQAQAIAVYDGQVLIAGQTLSGNFPVTNGAFQTKLAGLRNAFVTRIASGGQSLVFSTYLGGENVDEAFGIGVDGMSNAYVAGLTTSPNFPTLTPAQAKIGGPAGVNEADVFVTEVDTSGVLIYSTFYGGSGTDQATALAADPDGNVYVTGNTTSADFPVKSAYQATYPAGSSVSAFVLRLIPLVTINSGGTVNGAGFNSQPSVSAASIGSIFGTNLAASLAVASSLPLPTTLGDASVQVNGIAAPLYFVSQNQINFEMPWEVFGQTQVSITVTVNGATSSPQTVPLTTVGPGIFTINSSGSGPGVVQIANTSTFVQPANSIPGALSRPANVGDYLTIYCSGLGDVSTRPATGAATPSGSLVTTKLTPTVMIGGASVPVSFSGLAPGFVALYQVNVQVTSNVPAGNAVPLVLSIGGQTANTVTIAVQ